MGLLSFLKKTNQEPKKEVKIEFMPKPEPAKHITLTRNVIDQDGNIKKIALDHNLHPDDICVAIDGDNVYHYFVNCLEIQGQLHLMSLKEAENAGMIICDKCKEKEDLMLNTMFDYDEDGD